MRAPHKPFLLNIPTSLFEDLENARGDIGMDRTKFILQSIKRNVSFCNTQGLPSQEDFDAHTLEDQS